jgi:hypothetical protein
MVDQSIAMMAISFYLHDFTVHNEDSRQLRKGIKTVHAGG